MLLGKASSSRGSSYTGFQSGTEPNLETRPKPSSRCHSARGSSVLGGTTRWSHSSTLARPNVRARKVENPRKNMAWHVSDLVRRSQASMVTDRLVSRQSLRSAWQPSRVPRRWVRAQMMRSLPPSIGTCAPVVFAKSGPAMAATSSATSLDLTSTLRRLLRLYSSTLIP